jgi:hypothetical protein
MNEINVWLKIVAKTDGSITLADWFNNEATFSMEEENDANSGVTVDERGNVVESSSPIKRASRQRIKLYKPSDLKVGDMAAFSIERALFRERGLRTNTEWYYASSDDLSLEDESYAMANLSPRMTGVSRHVFVSPRMASHDVRVKVSVSPGKNTLPVNCATVGLRPAVHHVAGPALPASVMAEVERWIALNLRRLVDYWDGSIDTGELFAQLKAI